MLEADRLFCRSISKIIIWTEVLIHICGAVLWIAGASFPQIVK
jgi:hypothetical protein